MKKGVICSIVAAFLLQACSTIVHGTKQDLAIKTEPSGITARIGATECVTPCILSNVPRGSRELYLRKGETREQIYYLSNDKDINVGSAIFGNILWLGLGILVDFPSGSAYTIRDVYVRFDRFDDL